MVLRHTASAGLIALILALGACSDDDSDSPTKHAPDAAIDAGHGRAGDAGQSGQHAGGAPDAAAGDASTMPAHRMDGGSTSDASAPKPAHDAAPSSDGGGARDCDATLQSSIELETKHSSVLLVWDRSTSMTENWNGMQRWQGAGTAMINALTPIQDVLTIGAIFFPAEMPSAATDAACLIPGCACNVDAVTSSEQLPFQPGAQALQVLQGAAPSGVNPMYGPVGMGATTDPNATAAIGQTPTTEAMDQANRALAIAAFTGPAVVVLVTDGEPNCRWDQTHTTDLIAGWRSAYHVDTHVMLLPAIPSSGGQPSTAIPIGKALAAAGGTTLIQANDADALRQALSTAISHNLVQGVNSCSITIDPPAARPSDVQLVVTEHATGKREAAPHDLGKGSGWTMSKDGANVKLTGALCEDAKHGRFDNIELAYACETLAPVENETPSCTTAGTAYCGGACIDVVSDENNCGACEQKCGGGLTCCGGQCVDTGHDQGSCGACGSVCAGLCCGGECRLNDCGSCDNVCSGAMPCCCQGQCSAMPLAGSCGGC